MVCAAEHNPVAAVVLHSSRGDIEAVTLAGIWRKREGKLLPVRLKLLHGLSLGRTRCSGVKWPRRRRRPGKTIQQKIDRLDLKQAKEVLVETYKIDTTKSWIVYR
jgi:hypothetical protein